MTGAEKITDLTVDQLREVIIEAVLEASRIPSPVGEVLSLQEIESIYKIPMAKVKKLPVSYSYRSGKRWYDRRDLDEYLMSNKK